MERMNTKMGWLFALAVLVAACGGRETVASKSAAAYREAQEKEAAVTAGHEHGHEHGQAAATRTDAHAGHDMSTAADHAAMGHGAQGTTADHAAHGGMTTHAAHGETTDHTAHGGATDHAAHGRPRQQQHATHAAHGDHTTGHAARGTRSGGDHAAMGHGAAASGAHAQHGTGTAPGAHAQHSAPQPAPPAAHTDHGAHVAAASVTPAPRASGTALQPDAFDAPLPVSVAEAAKAQGGAPGGATHTGPAASPSSAAAVYTCPMHPEVTSDTPGTCPKCGMALVKKN